MTTDRSTFSLSLQALVDESSLGNAPLPASHTMSSVQFFNAYGTDRELKTSHCEVYDEQLLYLFYGRPAYRPDNSSLSTSNPSFRPISLLFKPESIGAIERIMPIDSGAFAKGLYKNHCPNGLDKQHFEISGDIDSAARLVDAFFGSNKNYYLGKLKSNLSFDPTNLVAQSYHSIVSVTGQTEFDDRRATIEIQSSNCLPLGEDTLQAIALPEDFLENEALFETITLDWKADIIPYDIYHDRPVHDVREVMSKVKSYLTGKGLL